MQRLHVSKRLGGHYKVSSQWLRRAYKLPTQDYNVSMRLQSIYAILRCVYQVSTQRLQQRDNKVARQRLRRARKNLRKTTMRLESIYRIYTVTTSCYEVSTQRLRRATKYLRID